MPDKQGESSAVPALISDLFQSHQNIPKGVITFDCAMTTSKILETIVETGNEYLGGLKGVNGNVYKKVCEYDWDSVEVAVQEEEKGHGREEKRETKIIKVSSLPSIIQFEFMKYKDAGVVIRVERNRLISKSCSISKEVAFYVGSIGLLKFSADKIYQIQRRHWFIKNRCDNVRDVLLQKVKYPLDA